MMMWRVNFRRPGDDDTELFVEVPASDQASAIVRAFACVWGAARLQRWGVKSVVQVGLWLALILMPAWASTEPASALLHTQGTVICLGWDTEYEGCVPFPHVVGLYLLDVGGGWFRSIKLLSDGSQIDEGLFCLDDRCRS